jgi:radical SAM superfamily enzyme YgiQ (UPF0313 family)
MRILLVAPKNPESFWTFDRILPVLGKKCLFPNLALPTVAALTPPGHQVSLCDENVEPLDFDAPVDLVGLTGYIVHRPRILEIAAEFRRRGRLVVIGGPYASLCPEELVSHADTVFVGEAEAAWPRMVEELAAGRRPRVVRAEPAPDLRLAPCPRFDLLRVERYRAMTVQFSRGCPYQCEFCDVTTLYGRRPRTKSPRQLVAELERLRELGATNVFVTDDNFVGHRKEAREALREIRDFQERGRPLELLTQASLNVAQDEELLAALRDANVRVLFVGIESPRPESLAEAHKLQNLRGDMIAAVHRIQSFGIEVMAGMIVGFDHDDPAVFEEHARFLERAGIPVSMTGMLNAIPATPLHRRLAGEGRLLPQGDLGDQFCFTNVIPARMSRLELYEGYRRLLARLYSYRNFRRRAEAALARIAAGSLRARWITGRHDLGIFFRTLRSCVLAASPARAWMTLRLLLGTALRRPRAFRSAVALALVHRHLHGYVRSLSRRLDRAIGELRRAGGENLSEAPERG